MKMSNKTYFCTLKPISKFFFGGERTFGENGTAKINYLVRSNPFPQQTTILGMLRFELLKQFKLLPITPINELVVDETIGKQSFMISEINPKYGFIENISPIFICSENDKMTIAPRDFVTYFDHKSKLITENWSVIKSPDSAFLYGSNNEFELKNIPEFSHKKTYLPHFKTVIGDSVLMNYDKNTKQGVFISDSQIGITKNSKNKDDKGFYKQFYYRMNKGYAFGFYLEASEEINEKSSIVFLGGEKSAFLLTIKDSPTENFNSCFGIDDTKIGTKITLLSDAFVNEDIYKFCNLGLVNTVQFRNIETKINQTISFHKGITKSEKVLNLLASGSVLFPNNFEEVKRILTNNNFKKIGYNIYKID